MMIGTFLFIIRHQGAQRPNRVGPVHHGRRASGSKLLWEYMLPYRTVTVQQCLSSRHSATIQPINVNTSVTFSSVSFVPENDLEYNFNHGHFCYLPTSGIETTLYMRHR